jgi:ferric-dicitrate binding protein FerR (iron transport regulator)
VLEDGTEVYMNTGSKIIFPNHFKSDSRIVEVEGEAYFKVTKDPNRPFIVKTTSFSTRVLGTEFNIRAYPQGESSVTLVTGKVLVTPGENEANQVTLSPGQNATCSGGQLLVKDVDVENYIAWKDGYFFFEEASLEDIMAEISRWYNVRVEYDNENLKKLKFKFWANRESSFQDAVLLLNQVGKVDIKMVSPGKALVMPAK